MKKIIPIYYFISLYTPIFWFVSVYKEQLAINSIPHFLVGAALSILPLYVMFNSDIKIDD